MILCFNNSTNAWFNEFDQTPDASRHNRGSRNGHENATGYHEERGSKGQRHDRYPSAKVREKISVGIKVSDFT